MLADYVFLRMTILAQMHWYRYTGTDCIASSIGWQLWETTPCGFLLPLHCIPRCHKNKKPINSKYDNTPFRAIPCFFPALRCAFFELAYANHSIQNASLRLATPPFTHLLVRAKSSNGSVAGEGNPRFPLSSLATCDKNSLHSTLFFYGLKKIKNLRSIPFTGSLHCAFPGY